MSKIIQHSLLRSAGILRRCACIVALIALAEACAVADRQLLNSERIERKYGSYGVEIVAQDTKRRLSSLYSGSSTGRVTRTIALVEFAAPINPKIMQLHTRILDGASIGSTFKADGWQVQKRTISIDEVIATSDQQWLAHRMHLSSPRRLAVHIYEFTVSRADTRVVYARIAEVHHSDYLDLDALHRFYGVRPFQSADYDAMTPAGLVATLDKLFALEKGS